jgi:DNA-directed RNA polymerase specialized sigma24 family protein
VSDDSQHAAFPRTSASLVALAADPASPGWRQAWERFFRDYWSPLYAWLRRTGTPAQEALDLLQDFFVAGLDGKLLTDWDAQRGRLRTYLLACLTNHRRKAWRREKGRPDRLQWLDEASKIEPVAGDPEAAFERDWTRCLQERAVATVEERLREAKDEAGVRLLREYVLAAPKPDATAFASALGVSRGALYTRATRLRQSLADEVERRLRWLETRPEVLAQERDAVLRLFREGT